MSVTFDGSTPHASAKGEPAPSSVLCWETWRLRAMLPKIVSRAMSFSALPRFDAALIGAVHRYYGIDVDVATAETEILEDDLERVRFFPWFLWDWPLTEAAAGVQTVGQRFLAEGDLEPLEARLLEALCASTVGFAEVVAIEGGTLVLHELLAGARGLEDEPPAFRLEDATLAREVGVGAILQARFLRVAEAQGPRTARAGIGLVDTIYAVLPAPLRGVVLEELARVVGDAADPEAIVARLKAHAPDLLEFAERLLEGLERTEPPVAEDGEALVLCATALTGPEAGELAARLGERLLNDARATRVVGLWRFGELGFIDARQAPRRVLVGASTRSAMTKLRTSLMSEGVALPVLQSEEDFPRAAAEWVERGHAGGWLEGDARAATAFHAWLGEWSKRWVDAPHPMLGRSPREAARDPLARSAVVELLRRMESVAGTEPVTRLGLQLGL